MDGVGTLYLYQMDMIKQQEIIPIKKDAVFGIWNTDSYTKLVNYKKDKKIY